MLVDIMQCLAVTLKESGAPAFQSGNLTYPTDGLYHQSVLISTREQIEGDETEHHDDGQYDGCG